MKAKVPDLSIAEAADKLGVHKNTLTSILSRGVHLERTTRGRVSAKSVEAYAAHLVEFRKKFRRQP